MSLVLEHPPLAVCSFPAKDESVHLLKSFIAVSVAVYDAEASNETILSKAYGIEVPLLNPVVAEA